MFCRSEVIVNTRGHRSARRLRLLLPLASVLVAPACGHLSDAEIVDRERAFSDSGLVCDRVHDVMKASAPGRAYADLPGVALLVARTYEGSGQIELCGDELLTWMRGAIETRPLDIRPRLEAQAVALGPFVASERWHGQALSLLDALLLGGGPRQLRWRENWNYLGPGSQKVAGASTPIVSSQDLDRAAATALVHGYLNREIDDAYADLLARLFIRRSSAAVALDAIGGFGRDVVTPPLDANRVGDGRSALDLVWPDLGRAFRRAPDHPRWASLSPTLRLRLSEARALTLSPPATRH